MLNAKIIKMNHENKCKQTIIIQKNLAVHEVFFNDFANMTT